jgi:hypothetical protein
MVSFLVFHEVIMAPAIATSIVIGNGEDQIVPCGSQEIVQAKGLMSHRG